MDRKIQVGIIVSLVVGLMLVPNTVMAKTFRREKYTVEYPAGCKPDKEENRFSNDIQLKCKGGAEIIIENSPTATDNMKYSENGTIDDNRMIDNMLTLLNAAWNNVEEVERGTDKYIINNQTAPYVIAKYDQTFRNYLGFLTDRIENWVYMVVAIKIGDDIIVAHYKNNEDKFDKDLPMAEKIFESIKPNGNLTTEAP